MYEWITIYLDYHRQEVGGPFEHIQLIIVDNDIPSKTRSKVTKIITFGADTGFLRDLHHPHGRPLTAE
ncbi:hypothetical protein [Actinoalloteichus fjordicus]|uniref:Uncharacterized protein n=1 Tax=Actinoalloteichus fjordicus TaxID=1612552 RepID=A0AAC9PSY4_9PSEU|nr:hypothetical protein [Actinoalloteichus fjordicus]APU15306.1 hypothetical protein UA74_16290 [Actinoalloteichus fjordicus]